MSHPGQEKRKDWRDALPQGEELHRGCSGSYSARHPGLWCDCHLLEPVSQFRTSFCTLWKNKTPHWVLSLQISRRTFIYSFLSRVGVCCFKHQTLHCMVLKKNLEKGGVYGPLLAKSLQKKKKLLIFCLCFFNVLCRFVITNL